MTAEESPSPTTNPSSQTQSSSSQETSPSASANTNSGPTWRPSGLLQSLVAEKEAELNAFYKSIEHRPDHPLNLRLAFYSDKTPSRLSKALKRSDGALAVVAEVKAYDLDILQDEKIDYSKRRDITSFARDLEQAGADALLWQVDEKQYGVSPLDLERFLKIRKERVRDGGGDPNEDLGGVPIIYRDLIVHPLQIAQASVIGADAVMLVAGAALTDLTELMNCATLMGMEVVVECHDELERDYALSCGATLYYLTNRDLTTGRVVEGNSEKLRLNMPDWCVAVGGGGMGSATDSWPLIDAGLDGVVVGKSLLQTRRQSDYIQEIQSEQKNMVTEFYRSFGYAGPPTSAS